MKLRVAFLDCGGHGDCAVVTFNEKGRLACIVVDGGNDAKAADNLKKYLESEKVKAIDLMVGTHIDSDHIQGLNLFVKKQLEQNKKSNSCILVKNFWGPKPGAAVVKGTSISISNFAPGSPTRAVILSAAQSDSLYNGVKKMNAKIEHPALNGLPQQPFTSLKLTVLGPDLQVPSNQIAATACTATTRASAGRKIRTTSAFKAAVRSNQQIMAKKAERDANNQSIVFRLEPPGREKWAILFAGDAEKESWARILGNATVSKALPARVLKVPHHGSENGLSSYAARKIAPKIAIISGDGYGLPDDSCLALLKSSAIYCPRYNTSNKPGACKKVANCPARNHPKHIILDIDTDRKDCVVSPAVRKCVEF